MHFWTIESCTVRPKTFQLPSYASVIHGLLPLTVICIKTFRIEWGEGIAVNDYFPDLPELDFKDWIHLLSKRYTNGIELTRNYTEKYMQFWTIESCTIRPRTFQIALVCICNSWFTSPIYFLNSIYLFIFSIGEATF